MEYALCVYVEPMSDRGESEGGKWIERERGGGRKDGREKENSINKQTMIARDDGKEGV